MIRIAMLCLALTACNSGPGSTPMEQDGLVTLHKAHDAKVLFTTDSPGQPPELLLPIFSEYSKTPLYLHIVWRTQTPPSTTNLKQFPGKRIKQFWDPTGKTPSTAGRLRVQGKLVELNRLALRMGFAHAAIEPD